MRTVYKSKIGWEFVVIMAVTIVPQIVLSFFNPQAVYGLLLLIPVGGFIFYLFTNTYYIIEGHNLIVKSGFLYNKIIDINTVRKIVETRNPISSPATSLDRLEVYFNKFDSVIISPKEKKGFIAHLLKLNPDIQWLPRKK